MTKKKKAKSGKAPADTQAKVIELDEVEQAIKEIEDHDRKVKEKKATTKKYGTIKEAESFHQQNETESTDDKMISEEQSEGWIKKAVSVVIQHLNKFGACVIDEFLGDTKGSRILNEVLDLQKHQIFQVIYKIMGHNSVNS